MLFVPIKMEDQLDLQALHPVRDQLREACPRDQSTEADEGWSGAALAGTALYELPHAEEGNEFGEGYRRAMHKNMKGCRDYY
jgi:hypothetical protein